MPSLSVIGLALPRFAANAPLLHLPALITVGAQSVMGSVVALSTDWVINKFRHNLQLCCASSRLKLALRRLLSLTYWMTVTGCCAQVHTQVVRIDPCSQECTMHVHIVVYLQEDQRVCGCYRWRSISGVKGVPKASAPTPTPRCV